MAKDIGSIDKNLKVESSFEKPDVYMYDVRQEPFHIYGLYHPQAENEFKRLPDELAQKVNDGVARLARNTAGGRVRFRTDSRYVALKTVMPSICHFSHMPLTGTSGFDLYLYEEGQSTFYKTFVPPTDMTDGYESLIEFPDSRERDIIIHFPLYNDVSSLYIGLQKSASLKAGSNYKHQTPVLYYGSSITQGGCASRPGNSYQAIISRRYDCDFLNFGFSGSARGEQNIIEYMAKLDFSIFVMDYDHNAPDAQHLQETYRPAYETIRKYNPGKPIIMISKPDIDVTDPEQIKRRSIIYTTYMEARLAGDQNVYFIDGYSLFGGEYRDSCTVDGCHPNDLGFCRMADTIGTLVGQLLK